MSGGTFNVSRSIWQHPEFKPEQFSEREAFLWLVSEASWKDRTARAGRVVVDLKRGQLCASIRFMADAWQWSKSRVDRFLKRLENRDMLVLESGTGQITITLCNYETFQGQRDTSGTVAGQSAGHERDSSGTNYKKDEIKKKESISDTDVSLLRDLPDRFQDFWDQYPHRGGAKKGRKPSEQKFKAALKSGATSEQIIAGAIRYASDSRVIAGYAKDPATWLNQRGWEDDIEPTSTINGTGGNGRASGSGDSMVDAFARVAARRAGAPWGGGGSH